MYRWLVNQNAAVAVCRTYIDSAECRRRKWRIDRGSEKWSMVICHNLCVDWCWIIVATSLRVDERVSSVWMNKNENRNKNRPCQPTAYWLLLLLSNWNALSGRQNAINKSKSTVWMVGLNHFTSKTFHAANEWDFGSSLNWNGQSIFGDIIINLAFNLLSAAQTQWSNAETDFDGICVGHCSVLRAMHTSFLQHFPSSVVIVDGEFDAQVNQPQSIFRPDKLPMCSRDMRTTATRCYAMSIRPLSPRYSTTSKWHRSFLFPVSDQRTTQKLFHVNERWLFLFPEENWLCGRRHVDAVELSLLQQCRDGHYDNTTDKLVSQTPRDWWHLLARKPSDRIDFVFPLLFVRLQLWRAGKLCHFSSCPKKSIGECMAAGDGVRNGQQSYIVQWHTHTHNAIRKSSSREGRDGTWMQTRSESERAPITIEW